LASSIVHAPFWEDVEILKLTINMRLLGQSKPMISTDRLRAESFANWLLTVGEGTENTTPTAELPSGMFVIKSHIH
jgi:hypothetical protein